MIAFESVCQRVHLPLPLWERSDRIADAIRVRGYALSMDLNPSPQPPPTKGEGAHRRYIDRSTKLITPWLKQTLRRKVLPASIDARPGLGAVPAAALAHLFPQPLPPGGMEEEGGAGGAGA